MNADKRRWNRGSLFLALLGSLFVSPTIAAEFKSQLGDEIERRFEAATIEVDESPIEFSCKFSKYIASERVPVGNFGWYPANLHLQGSHHLEEPASLPQPTIVETYIAKGFPSGEREKGIKKAVRDYSYHLAPDYRSYRGVTMLFDDERMLVAGQTFYR